MDVFFEIDEHEHPIQVERDVLPRICEARALPFGFSQRHGMPALPSDEVLVVATGHHHVGLERRDRAVVFYGDGVTVSGMGSFMTLIERRRERQLIVDSGQVSAGEPEAGLLRAFHRGREVGVCPDVKVTLVPRGRHGMSVLPDWREEAIRLAMFQLEVETCFWRDLIGSGREGAASSDADAALRNAEHRLERYRGWPPNRAEQVDAL